MNSTTRSGLHSILLQKNAGFSLVELMVAVAIIGILAAIAVPATLAWLPNHRLKSAARDVYATLQKARLLAVRENRTVRVVFDNTVNPGLYFIDIDGDGTQNVAGETLTPLAGYGSGVGFGNAGAADWNGIAIGNSVTFGGGPPPFCTYSSNGTSGSGTVYLQNQDNHLVYSITTVTSGAVKLRKYSGIAGGVDNGWIN